jgi:hypothetical protein
MNILAEMTKGKKAWKKYFQDFRAVVFKVRVSGL